MKKESAQTKEEDGKRLDEGESATAAKQAKAREKRAKHINEKFLHRTHYE